MTQTVKSNSTITHTDEKFIIQAIHNTSKRNILYAIWNSVWSRLYAQIIVSITTVLYAVTLRKNVIQIKQTNTYIIRGE